MRKIIYLFALTPFFIACNQTLETENTDKTTVTENKVSTNALLPAKIIVYNEVNYKNKINKDWTKEVDTVFMDNLNEQILSSDIILYEGTSGMYPVPNKIQISKDDIRSNMNKEGNISAIYFTESWSFDTVNYQLEKNVLKWAPVEAFYKKIKEEKSLTKTKKLLYDVETTFTGNEKLIASNITYELNFDSEYKTNDYLDIEKLVNFIINPVIEGKQKAYDFFSKKAIDINEIKINLGQKIDSIEEEDPVTGEWKWKIATVDIRLDQVKALFL